LVIDPRLEALLQSVAFAGFPHLSAANQDIQCSIRILVGPGEQRKPLWFHYDRSVVTMVVPIVIPNVGSRISGELILCPNRRPYRRFVMANIIEKLVSQNDLYRRKFARRLYANSAKVMPCNPVTRICSGGTGLTMPPSHAHATPCVSRLSCITAMCTSHLGCLLQRSGSVGAFEPCGANFQARELVRSPSGNVALAGRRRIAGAAPTHRY
jgi:hypothetical protein